MRSTGQAKGEAAWRPCATPLRLLGLPDRDRVDHALHGAFEAGLAEHEQELIGLVPGEFGGVHVLQDVGAVHRQQDLVHLEDILGLERDHLETPVVGADGDDALSGEGQRALVEQLRLPVLGGVVRGPGGSPTRPPSDEQLTMALLPWVRIWASS